MAKWLGGNDFPLGLRVGYTCSRQRHHLLESASAAAAWPSALGTASEHRGRLFVTVTFK